MARSSKKKPKKDDKKLTAKQKLMISKSPKGLKNIGKGILVNEKFKFGKDPAMDKLIKSIYFDQLKTKKKTKKKSKTA